MEMFCLLKEISIEFSPRIYVTTDTMSESKAHSFEQSREVPTRYSVHKVPRARAIGQSYFTSIFTSIMSFMYCIALAFEICPDLIICNGPGTCIPVVIACRCVNIMLFRRTRVIFVESFARVKHLSLTGKLMQYLADRLIVQWPLLANKNIEYAGRLV